MLSKCIVLIITTLFFAWRYQDKFFIKPPKVTGGAMKRKKLYMINFDTERAILFLAYLAIEYAIEYSTERFNNKTDIEKKCYTYFDTLEEKMKNKKLIKQAGEKVIELLEVIPKHETLGKPMIIRKLMGYLGQNRLLGEIPNIVGDKELQVDSNIYRNETVFKKMINIGMQNSMVMTTQILCDSRYNKVIDKVKKVETGATYKIFLDKEPFLTYNCSKNEAHYSFLTIKDGATQRISSTASTEEECHKIKKIKDKKEKTYRYVELYMSKAIKDIGIIMCSLVNDMPLLTQDAWVMLVANRVFNVEVIYSKPTESSMFYYYSKRVIDGFNLL